MNTVQAGLTQAPVQMYRDLEQAVILDQFYNTAVLKTVGEQAIDEEGYFIDNAFEDIEVWVNSIVGQTSSGSKTGFDFIQLLFASIDHPLIEGRYYIVENQYYISYYDNRVADVPAHLSVRRCNNYLRMIDPLNGSVYSIPCVVDYDMAASSNRIATAIITPNNHAVVKVQENKTTSRLFKTNTRFILGGRVFKISGYQNAINQFPDGAEIGMMDIDMFLDEAWDEDDFENGIAYNGTYDYEISIINGNIEAVSNSTGQLQTDITLNGIETTMPVLWSSSNEDVVTVDENGIYTVLGEEGTSADITAVIEGNTNVNSIITITVASEQTINPILIVNPNIDKIRQYETVTFTVTCLYGNVEYEPTSMSVSTTNENITLENIDNTFTIKCLNKSNTNADINIFVSHINPDFDINETIDYKLVSMMG